MALAGPSGAADHAAEILGPERGVLVREDVGIDGAEGSLGPVVKAVVEGLDDLFLEAAGARMRANPGFALDIGELGIGDTEYVHLDTGGDKRDHRMHVLWDAGRRVQR